MNDRTPAVDLDREIPIEGDGAHAPDVAREVDADVANLQRREVRRIVVPGAVDEVNQAPAARRLFHQGHLDERVGVGGQLPPGRQQAD